MSITALSYEVVGPAFRVRLSNFMSLPTKMRVLGKLLPSSQTSTENLSAFGSFLLSIDILVTLCLLRAKRTPLILLNSSPKYQTQQL
jgi:hypothetical protein